jgi:hypothetical protein
MDWLDEEDGDKVVLTQVTSFAIEVEPEETVIILKRARNALIRSRYKDCYLLAQELDKVCHVLTKRGDSAQLLASYRYDNFLDIAAAILEQGKDPLE